MTMTALLIALATLPALAQSDAPATRVHDYTYVDVGYQYLDIDVDNIREDAHGLGVAGGVQINEWFHLWAGTSLSRVEMEYVNVTTTTIGIGMGAHTSLTDNLSTYANVGYVTAEVEAERAINRDVTASISTDGNGYLLGAGIRASVLPKLELSAGLSLVSIEDEIVTSLEGGFAQPHR
jgi:opacity protein-like surface antigen